MEAIPHSVNRMPTSFYFSNRKWKGKIFFLPFDVVVVVISSCNFPWICDDGGVDDGVGGDNYYCANQAKTTHPTRPTSEIVHWDEI